MPVQQIIKNGRICIIIDLPVGNSEEKPALLQGLVRKNEKNHVATNTA